MGCNVYNYPRCEEIRKCGGSVEEEEKAVKTSPSAPSLPPSLHMYMYIHVHVHHEHLHHPHRILKLYHHHMYTHGLHQYTHSGVSIVTVSAAIDLYTCLYYNVSYIE